MVTRPTSLQMAMTIVSTLLGFAVATNGKVPPPKKPLRGTPMCKPRAPYNTQLKKMHAIVTNAMTIVSTLLGLAVAEGVVVGPNELLGVAGPRGVEAPEPGVRQ